MGVDCLKIEFVFVLSQIMTADNEDDDGNADNLRTLNDEKIDDGERKKFGEFSSENSAKNAAAAVFVQPTSPIFERHECNVVIFESQGMVFAG